VTCPDFHYTEFPAYFDAYVARAKNLDPAQVSQDLQTFRSYYFDFNADPERLARLEELARRVGARP
jgi:hypothetical protein